jgi:hypothetical protein
VFWEPALLLALDGVDEQEIGSRGKGRLGRLILAQVEKPDEPRLVFRISRINFG